MEKHKPVPLCDFIHHGEKPLKTGCVFPQTILHSKQQPCLHWKIPQWVETCRGQPGTSQETERKDLEKQVHVLTSLKKVTVLTINITQAFRRSLREKKIKK